MKSIFFKTVTALIFLSFLEQVSFAEQIHVGCSNNRTLITEKQLLMAIYVNHQLHSLADQVLNVQLYEKDMQELIDHAKKNNKNTVDTIRTKIPVRLDLSTWPIVDSSQFDQINSHYEIEVKTGSGEKIIRGQRKEKTLKDILNRLCLQQLQIDRPPTLAQIKKGNWETYLFFQSLLPINGNVIENLGDPERTLIRALEELEKMNIPAEYKNAIDLGSGQGRDTLALLKLNDWKVHAIDSDAKALENLRFFAQKQKLDFNRLQIYPVSFENLNLEHLLTERGYADTKIYLINASYSLPYADSAFEATIRQIKNRLAQGGFFSGQFFGDQDPLATGVGVKTVSLADLAQLFPSSEFEKIILDSELSDGVRVDGTQKKWHVFHAVFKKISP